MDRIVYGKYILSDASDTVNGLIKEGAVLVRGERIAEIGTFPELRKKYPQAELLGGTGDFVMPGIIDAHSHGRGISYVQKGIPYDYLENCLFDWVGVPNLPEDLDAQLMAVKHIRNGSTMLHMNKSVDLFDENVFDKAKTSIENYNKVGMRVAYSPGIKDVNALANDDEAFYETLPPKLQKAVRPMVFFDKAAAQDYYIDLFSEMREKLHQDMGNILLGPFWAHGCTDAFYEKIKIVSQKYGAVPMHIHTLQTPHQKAYGEQKYGKSLLAHMDELGIVDSNLVLGHAVYLNESDIACMAERHASITHHPSCNLIMRNGIAPVYEMVQKGVNVALGMDEKQINDDEDALHELRMIFYLHRMSGYELGETPALTPRQVLSMGTVNGAKIVGMEGRLGALRPGMLADLIVVDMKPIEEDPWISPDADVLNTFIHRVQGRYVKHVMINGDVVMRDRKFTHIDVEGLYREVKEYMDAAYRKEPSGLRKIMMEVKPYYLKWNAGKVKRSEEVFYRLNERR